MTDAVGFVVVFIKVYFSRMHRRQVGGGKEIFTGRS